MPSVHSPVRRAGAFAVVGSLALMVPLFEAAAAAPFAAIAALAVFSIEDGPLFELFARPGERRERRLYGLIGFALAATALALLAAVSAMPVGVGVGAILLVAYGNFGAELVRSSSDDLLWVTTGFAVGGGLGCVVGQVAALRAQSAPVAPNLPELAFLAASGAALGALLRTLLFETDDPHIMLTTGLWLWLLSELATAVTPGGVVVALVVTLALGYGSYALETASVSGMLTGITMGLVMIVLGGVSWFVLLFAFSAIGGLATKYRYDHKLDRGVAEENGGVRSTANVVANGAVGFLAVLAYAAVNTRWQVGEVVIPAIPEAQTAFLFAFAGSLATATSDTLSSEVGGAYDDVRLITTLEPVEPGTDGGVTWQGEVAGLAGAGAIGVLALVLFDPVGPLGAAVVCLAGFAGMTVDSVLGATLEGGLDLVGNGSVNALATLSGAVVAGGCALALGLV